MTSLISAGFTTWIASVFSAGVRSITTFRDRFSESDATLQGVQLTELGWEFVEACDAPSD